MIQSIVYATEAGRKGRVDYIICPDKGLVCTVLPIQEGVEIVPILDREDRVILEISRIEKYDFRNSDFFEVHTCLAYERVPKGQVFISKANIEWMAPMLNRPPWGKTRSHSQTNVPERVREVFSEYIAGDLAACLMRKPKNVAEGATISVLPSQRTNRLNIIQNIVATRLLSSRHHA